MSVYLKNVLPSVIIQIDEPDAPSDVPRIDRDAGLLAYVFERSIPTIVVQGRPPERQAARAAEDRHPFPLAVRCLAWRGRAREIELLIAGDEQIETTIPIVVEKRAAG